MNTNLKYILFRKVGELTDRLDGRIRPYDLMLRISTELDKARRCGAITIDQRSEFADLTNSLEKKLREGYLSWKEICFDYLSSFLDILIPPIQGREWLIAQLDIEEIAAGLEQKTTV